MKNVAPLVAAVVFSTITLSYSAAPEPASKPNLQTPTQKYSYIIGLDIGKSLKGMNTEIDGSVLLWGIEDVLKNRKLLLSDSALGVIQQEFGMIMQAKREEAMAAMKGKGEKNLKEGEAFLAGNKKKRGVVTTASGLQYSVIKKGNGPKPTAADKVRAHYRGTLIDGKEFDASTKHGTEPALFPVTGVIPGWTEALQLMSVGSKYRLFIPSNLAYGERGAGDDIGPNATLIFEVELVSIEK